MILITLFDPAGALRYSGVLMDPEEREAYMTENELSKLFLDSAFKVHGK
jgi:hypothetical protein